MPETLTSQWEVERIAESMLTRYGIIRNLDKHPASELDYMAMKAVINYRNWGSDYAVALRFGCEWIGY